MWIGEGMPGLPLLRRAPVRYGFMLQIMRDTVKAMLDRATIGRKMSDPKRALPAFARIFMNGRSQAVRLPREFRFDTDKVAIRREGRNVPGATNTQPAGRVPGEAPAR